MAYHDDKPGYTPIIVGRRYSRWNGEMYHNSHKLIIYNQTTGICGLRSRNETIYISATELSNWYILGE